MREKKGTVRWLKQEVDQRSMGLQPRQEIALKNHVVRWDDTAFPETPTLLHLKDTTISSKYVLIAFFPYKTHFLKNH